MKRSKIVLADLGTDIIQMAVDPVGLDAPAFGATAADFPQMFRNGKFSTELRDAAIDRNPAHNRNQRRFLLFVPFKVEQNLECAAHKLCFLMSAKIKSAESYVKMNKSVRDCKSLLYEERGKRNEVTIWKSKPRLSLPYLLLFLNSLPERKCIMF